MKVVIIANKESLMNLCGKSVLERLIDFLIEEEKDVYVYPAKYKKILSNKNAKFLRSLNDLKEKSFVIKGNVFLENIDFEKKVLVGENEEVIAYYGFPSKKFDMKGELKKIKAFEIKNEKDLRKAEKKLNEKFTQSDFVSKHINKIVSEKLSLLVCRSYITSNQLFTISFLFSLLAFLFFLPSEYLYIVFAGIFIQISGIIHSTAEKISFLRNGKKNNVINIFSDFAIIVGLSSFLWNETEIVYIWIISLIMLAGMAVVELSEDTSLIGRSSILFILFIGCLLNQILVAMLICSILVNACAIKKVILQK
ncbi:MAG TPA: hypothetical protein ENI52_05010 [Thermoplasmata archaeon]|nr:hypothetical protein [Thermoplasmata archaeon]